MTEAKIEKMTDEERQVMRSGLKRVKEYYNSGGTGHPYGVLRVTSLSQGQIQIEPWRYCEETTELLKRVAAFIEQLNVCIALPPVKEGVLYTRED